MSTVIRTSEELLSAFECVICTSMFEMPKNLPNCGHTYCLKCVDALPRLTGIRGNGVACPECRVVSPIARQGAAGYQTNISTQRMVDSMRHQLSKGSAGFPSSGATSFADCDAHSYNVDGCPHASMSGFLAFGCPHCNCRFCQACQINHMERLKDDIRNISGSFDQRMEKATENISDRTKQITDCYSEAVEKASGQISKSADELVKVVTDLIRRKANDLVHEARQAASENLETVRKTIENCQMRRARLRQSVDQLVATSVLKLTLQEISGLHGEVMARDSQIRAMETLCQGHLANIYFRPAEEVSKLVEALEDCSLGSIRTQVAVHRFNNPWKLRQAKSCFNVTFPEPAANSPQAAGDDSYQTDDEDDHNAPDVYFHPVCGVHANISSNGARATKTLTEFTQSVCFTNRPIQPGERIQLACVLTDASCVGGSAIGFTSLDPASIPEHHADLLADDCLMNGGSHFYWVTSDVLAENGAVAVFSYDEDGNTHVELKGDSVGGVGRLQVGEDSVPVASSRGGGSPESQKTQLWGVVNLFGATSCIKINTSR